MKKTTRLMSLIIAAALILSGCNQNNVVSHGIPDTNGSDTTTTTTAITTSVTTTEATTTTSAAASETKETTPATTVSIEETTVPVDAEVDVTEDTTTPAETTEITAEQAPVETTATTTSVTETTAVTTVSTKRATTTSTVILAYTSASVANKPEPAHIYIQEYDQLGQGLIYITGFNDDIQTGAYFIIETEDNLDYALKKAYKYWDDTYGNAYGEAQAKVIYYTGKTYLYTRNGGTTTATTTSASATSGTTIAKPVTTAVETTASTTARTTTASTTAKPQTALLLQPNELQPDIIIIDEPELSLHPYTLTILAEMIKQASHKKQLVFSTHSIELLNEFGIEDIVVADREGAVTKLKRVNQEELKEWLDDYSVGELWQKNLFGGRN